MATINMLSNPFRDDWIREAVRVHTEDLTRTLMPTTTMLSCRPTLEIKGVDTSSLKEITKMLRDKRNPKDYDFHLPHPDMLDVAKIQEELSMEKPLAILEWDGKVKYVFAPSLIKKACSLKLGDTLFPWTESHNSRMRHVGWPEDHWHEDHSKTKQVVQFVREVVNAPWPNKPEDPTCKVTLVEV